MIIFSIETSCDETAAAIVENGTREICSVVASSKEFHEKTGGVVPEIAARKQVESITPVIAQCFEKFREYKKYHDIKNCYDDVDAVAVTVGPGLIGSLIVGVEAAKTLSLFLNKPLLPVNHLIGHLYANYIEEPGNEKHEILFPATALLVSGGHTDIVLMKDYGVLEYVGGTLDDAAGESYDKVARLLGISQYLGGAALSAKAQECRLNTVKGKLPRPMMDQDNYDFSFSGLKSATRRLIEEQKNPIEAVAREFEDAVVEVLVKKTIKATKEFNAKSVLLGGGVSANSFLRDSIKKECENIGVSCHIPPLRLCTDNAVYIASAAYFLYINGYYNTEKSHLDVIQPNPSLGIMDRV